jgi:hypothetical protein
LKNIIFKSVSEFSSQFDVGFGNLALGNLALAIL